MAGNIYEQIIGDLKAEKNAWCKDFYHCYDESKKAVSVCLVGAVERATGVAYIKPTGKAFTTKDPKKVDRAIRIVRNLANLIDPEGGYDARATACGTTPTPTKDLDLVGQNAGDRFDHATEAVTSFNDDEDTKKADVIRLLKRAAKTYPND